MSSGVFVLDHNNTLHELSEQQPETEDYLQRLLAEFPRLIPGDLINPESPRKWLLVSREMALGDSDESTGRWSLDHVFVDQDSIPTIVEVKRSSDTRIRREVIGQILEYAANASRYCPTERLQSAFERRCAQEGRAPDEVLRETLGAGLESAEFWNRVGTNLRAGKLRLILLADVVPAEARRIIEFLNEQMEETELLAVEIRQYGRPDGLRTLVPRVYGLTEQAAQTKNPGARPKGSWTRESVLQQAESRFSGHEREVMRLVLAWAETQPVTVAWGTGRQDGSFSIWYPTNRGGTRAGTPVLTLHTTGHLEVSFQWWNQPPFAEEAGKVEVLKRLNSINGVQLPIDSVVRRPSIPFAVLNEQVLPQVLRVFEWMIAELKRSAPREEPARK